MTKKKTIVLCGLAAAAVLLAFRTAISEDTRRADHAAVERAVKDYVEAFYQVKPEYLERSLSKDLKKMGFWRPDAESEYKGPLHMNFDQAISLSKKWNAEGKKKNLTYEVKVFEVFDKIAAAKVTAEWGFDYMHLVKEDGRWRIHHVMWQSHPESKG